MLGVHGRTILIPIMLLLGHRYLANLLLLLLQQAASQHDNRAQKLLSKLYYAGHGVEQDREMGKYWLELAAAHGHPDAIRISQGIATLSLLKQTQREDTSYGKKMALATAALIIFMILIFVAVKV